MAEALLKKKIDAAALGKEILVMSAGLSTSTGLPASSGASAAMRRRGVDMAYHSSRQLSPEFVQAADLVLTMTMAHKQLLVRMLPQYAGKFYTLAEFAGVQGEVTDPFGGDDQVYEQCASELERLIDKAWQKIANSAGKTE
jgi:protein-tyrosine phosphatase